MRKKIVFGFKKFELNDKIQPFGNDCSYVNYKSLKDYISFFKEVSSGKKLTIFV